jgi:hypothetical protein
MEGTGTHTPTYEEVVPLFVTSRVNGHEIEYVFRCPVTGVEHVGVVGLEAQPRLASFDLGPRTLAREHVQNKTEIAVDRALPGARLAAELLGGVFEWRRNKRKLENPPPAPSGDDPAARVAQEQAHRMMLDAFAAVADRFTWDGARWVGIGT